jgi:trk system potassium uptake protein
LPIDVIISPELEVANGIVRRLKTPGAFDTVSLARGRVQLLGIHCNTGDCAMIGRRLNELPALLPGSSFVVVAIVRGGEAFVPRGEHLIEQGDDLYVITDAVEVERVTAFLGHQEQIARRVVIVGGGNVGLSLAKQLARSEPSLSIKLIEQSRELAEFVSRELGAAAVVLQGDALDKEALAEAHVGAAETIIAVTNDDETNIFASVLAKREGCARAIALVNKRSYEPLLPALGIDAVVSPSEITVSTVLRHVRHGSISALHSLREDFGEVIEATAQEGSRLAAGTLKEVGLPDGMLIGALVRGGEVIIPTSDTRVRPGDNVIAVVTYRALRKAEAILAGVSRKSDA